MGEKLFYVVSKSNGFEVFKTCYLIDGDRKMFEWYQEFIFVFEVQKKKARRKNMDGNFDRTEK